jgi:RNA polymerase sigma-70 factor (ECF subfamily)
VAGLGDFDAFFEEHYPALFRALTLVFDDPRLAEDAAQEGFFRAYRHWRTVAAMDRPATWVYVVAVRSQRRRLAKEERADASNTPPDRPLTPEDTAVEGDLVDRLLNTLTPRQRQVVVLRYVAGLSLAEIAEALGCALGTVKATIHVSLEKMHVEAEETADAY